MQIATYVHASRESVKFVCEPSVTESGGFVLRITGESELVVFLSDEQRSELIAALATDDERDWATTLLNRKA